MRCLSPVLGLEPFEQALFDDAPRSHHHLLKLGRPSPKEQQGLCLEGLEHVRIYTVEHAVCAEVPSCDRSACVWCVMFILSTTSKAEDWPHSDPNPIHFRGHARVHVSFDA